MSTARAADAKRPGQGRSEQADASRMRLIPAVEQPALADGYAGRCEIAGSAGDHRRLGLAGAAASLAKRFRRDDDRPAQPDLPVDPGRDDTGQRVDALLDIGGKRERCVKQPGDRTGHQDRRGQPLRKDGSDLTGGGAHQPEHRDEPADREQRAEAGGDGRHWPRDDGGERLAEHLGRRQRGPPDEYAAHCIEPACVSVIGSRICQASAPVGSPRRTDLPLYAAASWSAVARTTVLPSLCKWAITPITRAAADWSRPAVGSSQSTRLGLATSALASAHSVSSPADNCHAIRLAIAVRPTRSRLSATASSRCGRGKPAYRSGSMTLSSTDRVGSTIFRWNTKPICRQRSADRWRSRSLPVSMPFSR